MACNWPLLSTVICALEGAIGLLANLFLILLVVSSRSRSTIPAYRFAIAVSAVQGAFNSLLLLAGLWTHVLSDGYFISIVYGPVKYAPKQLRTRDYFMDTVQNIAVFMVFSLWHFLTAPCIMQYLVLFRKSMPNIARVAIAYLFTGFSMALSAPYFTLLDPYPAVEEQMKVIARRVHALQDSEFLVIYGIGMHEDPANGNRTAFGLAFYGIAPSYLLTYVAFGFTVFKIVSELGRVNTGMSINTIRLQWDFIRTQLIQASSLYKHGVIPLAILAVPFALFDYFILTGANLGKWTLLLTFSLWSLPAVQAFVYLEYFVQRILADINRTRRLLLAVPSTTLSSSTFNASNLKCASPHPT